ncbi:rubrerythrin [Rhizomicrobium palustre]|uniref:Rubrerythrin n=1 Tax=Rhizomicrobium palustre TaxID=189966 RepID=A0A846N3A5_9PROT|nr:ferritin-like domain-containing protein [Rhizomicrobium palustre]NIK90093.1 rubrerythrin [Rhizomicrobium palustre]
MVQGPVYKAGWNPDDIAWEKFDPSKAESWMIDAIKSAALVEYNAPDYVSYLKRIFPDPDFHPVIEQWGREESQHGKVLGRWAEMADPNFKLEEAFERFRAGYRPEHFDTEDTTSVRGSRKGEMIARCVVESGTSSYYTAIKEATAEPVLQEIAGRIAADEYRHYRLFYETEKTQQGEADLPFWKKLLIAIGRITESDDDEIAFSHYCATVPAAEMVAKPYDRRAYSKRIFEITVRVYRKKHIHKLTQMVAKAVGADPQGKLVQLAGGAIWRMLRMRAGLAGVHHQMAS